MKLLCYKYLLTGSLILSLWGCNSRSDQQIVDAPRLARQFYGADAQWYLDNIPFFECSDKQIEAVYYYRWKMYKAHIRHVGKSKYVITEFINHVPWDREPFCTINAASMHHIYEGRWLKNSNYMDAYIDYLNKEGGNDRRYSESVADATFNRYLVDLDSAFVVSQLDSLKNTYRQWSDHRDSSKNMYYIPAMPDATEYTIASIDASGGKDGFEDGEAFRPTINSYLFGNAQAIARIAELKGDAATSKEYRQYAAALKKNVEQYLWNDSLQHFSDRFKVNNQYVHYWEFIRGRELAGYAPWYFNLPGLNEKYTKAWNHLVDTSELLGPFGYRTNEPSYQYYFKQYQMFEGKPGSQWNGPSWPYQTSQALTGMANLLHNYQQKVVGNSDYVHALKMFAKQHYLPDGRINLVENYEPNKGGPIVHFYWSNHYNHSSFNNLVITGLAGIRPSASDSLFIHPLVDSSISYFCLSDLLYHGHKLTVVYDRDGSQYKMGRGLTVFLDGKKLAQHERGGKSFVVIGKPLVVQALEEPADLALNIAGKGFPLPSASVNAIPDSLYKAIDGRIWYFTEISNRWTTLGSTAKSDWYGIDFGNPMSVSGINVYPFADEKTFFPPDSIRIEYQKGAQWLNIPLKESRQDSIVANTGNRILFEPVKASRIRVHFAHDSGAVAISELEVNP